jgi:hypothetical protein
MKKIILGMVLLLFIASGCQATVTPESTPVPESTSVPEFTPTPEDALATVIPTAVSQTQTPANADVVYVKAVETAVSTWTFAVSVDHPDTGWEDYADGWDVLLPDGTVLKPTADSPFTRLLAHPHVGERPFTRSQSRIAIPADVTTVTVRAHDLVDGFGGQEVVVDLTAVSGDKFEVERFEP